MKPLVGYYGGKQRIATRIVEQLNIISHSIYAEPFAGGLSVLFAKHPPARNNKSDYIEAINDNNELLITLYRVARERPQEFFELIQWTPYAKAELSRANQIYQGIIPADDLEKAWAVFVTCHFSFSHKIGAGWRIGRQSANVASQWNLTRDRLQTALLRLCQVHIDCVDALDFIKRWDSPNTLFYLDPPYPGADQGHYAGYSLDGFKALCKALDGAQGSYVLSNYPQNIEPASAQQCIELDVTCSASGVGRIRGSTAAAGYSTARTEVLWICDRSPARTHQQSLFDLAS